jgi:1-acyl-sn-glycerol-3-phosphate acyltransferase
MAEGGNGSALRTIAVLAFSVVFVLALGVPMILYSLLRRSAELMFWTVRGGFAVVLALGGIRLEIEGLENIPAGVCLFAANHVSDMDPPAVTRAIPRRISVLAKKELFRIPLVGHALRMAKIVPIDRSSRDSTVASIEESVRHMREGMSFLVFAEGTRSPDGRLRHFKKGAFAMAIDAGVPVVPVSICGMQKVLAKGQWKIASGEVRIRMGRPVDALEYTQDGRGELMEEVEARVAEGLPEDQKPLEEA